MRNDLLRAALRLAIDYLRWTQLIPMLAVWGFLLACVLVAALASFESQSIAALEVVIAAIAAFAQLLPASIAPRSPDGTLQLSGNDLLNALLWAWFIVSLFGVIISSLIGPRLRPSFLETLGGRVKASGVAAALVSAAFFALYAAEPDQFNGTLTSALPLFIGGPLIAWIVSAWSLTISTALSLPEEGIGRAYSGIRDE